MKWVPKEALQALEEYENSNSQDRLKYLDNQENIAQIAIALDYLVSDNNIKFIDRILGALDHKNRFNIIQKANVIKSIGNKEMVKKILDRLDESQQKTLLSENDAMYSMIKGNNYLVEAILDSLKSEELKKELLVENLKKPGVSINLLVNYFNLLDKEERIDILNSKEVSLQERGQIIRLLELEERPKLRKMLSEYGYNESKIKQSIFNKIGNFLANFIPGRKTDIELFGEMKTSRTLLIASEKIENRRDSKLIKQRPELDKLIKNSKNNYQEVDSIKNKISHLMAEVVPGRDTDKELLERIERKKKIRESREV